MVTKNLEEKAFFYICEAHACGRFEYHCLLSFSSAGAAGAAGASSFSSSVSKGGALLPVIANSLVSCGEQEEGFSMEGISSGHGL